MRTIKQLATEFGTSERQFHRLLDAGNAKVRLALRQEVLWELSIHLSFRIDDLETLAKALRRCDPEIAAACLALAEQLNELCDTPASAWHVAEEKRQLEAE